MKIDWRTRSGKAIIATAVIMTILVLLTTAVFVALMPVTVVMGKPATLNIKAPGGYETTKQTFIKTFPDFTATNFHYSNPYLGPPEGPWGTLTINARSVSAKATDTSLHVTADTLDVPISLPFGGVFQLARIKCNSLEADVKLWTPDPNTGEFGTLVATLKGNVLFHVPNIPGLPLGLTGGYHYEGQSLTITLTFFEPIYTVTVTPSSQGIPQGCNGDFEVTVTPLDADITGSVNLRWPEELDKQGIHGAFTTGGGTPPLTATLTVYVEPRVSFDTYDSKIIVYDWTTGKDFKSPITIDVEESGFDVTVNGDNPFSTSIQQGTSQGYKIEVTPLTCYGVGMGLYWRPTSGDFAGIGVEMPCGIQPSQEVEMVIKVGSEVQPGPYGMDVCVFDGSLRQEFCCHVTIEIKS